MTPAEKPPHRRSPILELLPAGAALLFFVWLGEEVLRGGTQPFDDCIRLFVRARATPVLTTAMRGFSLMGEPGFLIVLGALVIAGHTRKGRPRTALLFFLTVLGSEVFDQLLKLVFHRIRPVAFFGLSDPIGYSFPSGHALVSCTFFGVLAAIAAARAGSRARRGIYYTAAALLIAAIGFSRIYLGVHYPSDVLAGYAAAVVWVFSVALARRLPRLRKPRPPARRI
jgi:undecaprenyl-diphosphatase